MPTEQAEAMQQIIFFPAGKPRLREGRESPRAKGRREGEKREKAISALARSREEEKRGIFALRTPSLLLCLNPFFVLDPATIIICPSYFGGERGGRIASSQ